jgi:hypothetical protein
MSNRTLDAVKELAEKTLNLSSPETPHYRETAYIYNGLGELTLPYLGMYTYQIPFEEVTTINAVEHREVDQSKSFHGESVFMAIHLPGESIARELIETRKYSQKGCAVFFDGPEVPEELKEKCDHEGERFRLGEIEAFKVNREKAKSGTAGYKIKPDKRVYEWMRIHTPDDEVFASQSRRTSREDQTALAINKLADIAGQLARQQETSPEPVVEEPVAHEPVAEGVPVIKRKRGRPKRKPPENPEDHK